MTKSTRKQLVAKLDAAFSQYVRLRYAVAGDATCVTCGVSKPWKQMQAGHYESRGYYPTRWDEHNVHVQCYGCNVARKGNYPMYARYMVARYGASILDELHLKAHSGVKIPTPVLAEYVDYYQDQVKRLLDGTHIDELPLFGV